MGFYKGLSGTRKKALLVLEREWRWTEGGMEAGAGGVGHVMLSHDRWMGRPAATTTMMIIIDRFSLG